MAVKTNSYTDGPGSILVPPPVPASFSSARRLKRPGGWKKRETWGRGEGGEDICDFFESSPPSPLLSHRTCAKTRVCLSFTGRAGKRQRKEGGRDEIERWRNQRDDQGGRIKMVELFEWQGTVVMAVGS